MIIPLAKVNDPIAFEDLRPISILPALSKVCERVLLNQLRVYLEDNILPSTQSGFRAGFICTTTLLGLTVDILTASDRGNLTALVLLDFSKAFDSINHELMLSILHYAGLNYHAVDLLRSYISDRVQCVSFSNAMSSTFKLFSGVPQGSVLGPGLYSVYTSYLCRNLEHSVIHM